MFSICILVSIKQILCLSAKTAIVSEFPSEAGIYKWAETGPTGTTLSAQETSGRGVASDLMMNLQRIHLNGFIRGKFIHN